MKVGRRAVQTTRLDDVPAARGCHYLKLDVQGGELRVLHGARELLQAALVVHIEVAFDELYTGQPLFGTIDCVLPEAGFTFIDFTHLTRYTHVDGFPSLGHRDSRLLWGDAVYVQSDEHLAPRPAVDLLLLAEILHVNYAKYDLAAHALRLHHSRCGTAIRVEYIGTLQ